MPWLATALPILGAALPIVQGLFGGNHNQGQASSAAGAAAQQSQFPGQMQQQYLPALLHWLSSNAQDPNFVNEATAGLAQSDPMNFGPMAAKSMTPAFNTAVSQYGDNVGNQLAQENGATAHDMGGRGFFANNSAEPSLFAGNERAAQSEVGQQRANIGGQAANAMQQLAQWQFGQRQGIANNLFNRVEGATGAVPGANTSGLQNSANYYQGLANNANSGFLTGIGNLANLPWQHLFGGHSTGGGTSTPLNDGTNIN